MTNRPGPSAGTEPAAPVSVRSRSRRNVVLTRLSELGASAQAAIPGLYAWSITVAPAAWSRGAPLVAKVAAIAGVIALTTAPLVEGAGVRRAPPAEAGEGSATPAPPPPKGLAALSAWTGPTWARIWSVWGFVLSSAIVWTLAPSALSSARLDGVRGALGVVGWALFAFASAGPSLRADPEAAGRIIAGSSLKPRSELQQRRDPPSQLNRPRRRAVDPRQERKQSGFARAVPANDRAALAGVDVEVDSLQDF